MTKIITALFGDIKERLVIKNLQATEFAERLQGHVDSNKKGLLSNSKSDFYGTIGKNSFKLQTNKIFKSEDFGIYGEFNETEDGLTVDIAYTRSFIDKLIPLAVLIAAIYLIVKITSDKGFNIGFILFIIIFSIGFLVTSLISKTNEFDKLSKTIRTTFQDKEIRELNAR